MAEAGEGLRQRGVEADGGPVVPFGLRQFFQIDADIAQVQPCRREARPQHHGPRQGRPSGQGAAEGAEGGALGEVRLGVVGQHGQRDRGLIQDVAILFRCQQSADQIAADVGVFGPVVQRAQQEARGLGRLPGAEAQEAVEVAGAPVGKGGFGQMCFHPMLMRREWLTKGLRGRRFFGDSTTRHPWARPEDRNKRRR